MRIRFSSSPVNCINAWKADFLNCMCRCLRLREDGYLNKRKKDDQIGGILDIRIGVMPSFNDIGRNG
ncbi:hypothetical protein TNCV_1433101 [Trichonephila clavipes]|nr:hypothetical protein TNCV_1433101 [Trichonephila clavipes]